MNNNVKFLLILFVLLPIANNINFIQAQENNWAPETGDIFDYTTTRILGGEALKYLETNDLEDNNLVSFYNATDSMFLTGIESSTMQIINLEDLSHYPYDIEDDENDDTLPYWMSIDTNLNYLVDRDYIHEEYGDTTPNVDDEWTNFTDIYDDTYQDSDKEFKIAFASQEFYFLPEFYNSEGYENFSESIEYEMEVCIWGDCRYDTSKWVVINVTATTSFQVMNNIDYQTYMTETKIEGIQSGIVSIAINRYRDYDAPLVNVDFELEYNAIQRNTMIYSRTELNYGKLLRQTIQDDNQLLVEFNSDETEIFNENENVLNDLGEIVSVNGSVMKNNIDYSLMELDSFRPAEGNSGEGDGLQLDDELLYERTQNQSFNNIEEFNEDGELYVDEEEAWISVTSDFYLSVYEVQYPFVNIVNQDIYSLDGVQMGGDYDIDSNLDSHDSDDVIKYDANLIDGQIFTSETNEINWNPESDLEYDCLDLNMFDNDNSAIQIQDHNGNSEFDNHQCYPPLFFIIAMSDEFSEYGPMQFDTVSFDEQLVSLSLNEFEYLFLLEEISYLYNSYFQAEFEFEGLSISYELQMNGADKRSYDNNTGALLMYSTIVDMNLSMQITQEDGELYGNFHSYYSFEDRYQLVTHTSKYTEAQDPNDIPQITTETNNTNGSENQSETTSVSTEVGGISLPAGLPGFEGAYAFLGLSIMVLIIRKFRVIKF